MWIHSSVSDMVGTGGKETVHKQALQAFGGMQQLSLALKAFEKVPHLNDLQGTAWRYTGAMVGLVPLQNHQAGVLRGGPWPPRE